VRRQRGTGPLGTRARRAFHFDITIARVCTHPYIGAKIVEIIMSVRVEQFKKERERLNRIVLSRDVINTKRFFALDSAVYRPGALDEKTKELLGLVASLTLRCDDCIAYHTIRAREVKTTDDEFDEVMSIGLVVGGSITIPHIRRAYELWEETTT
jgi:AhpD family alkylhydroperoxidase